MEQIIVTHIDSTTLALNSRANVSNITSANQNVELLGADTVDISVQSGTKLVFYIGDKISIFGRDYTLNTPPKETKKGERLFIYDLQFEGVQYDLLRVNYSVNVDTTSNEIQDFSGDSLTGNLKRFLDVLLANANRVFPDQWVLGTYPETSETKSLTFGDSDNCLSVLQNLCSESNYNTEFSISISESGIRTINIGTVGNSHPFSYQYGKGKGLYELSRQKVSSTNIVTRLNVYGSSKNINTLKYRALKLCLPGMNKAQSYLESESAIEKFGIWEQTKNFEDVYPHRVGTVTGLGSSELKFMDENMNFDLNAKDTEGNTLYLIPSTPAKIHFNTGNLAGFEFEISTYDHATTDFTLKSYTDENGYTFPSPSSAAFQFAVGDEYALVDIYQPQSYIDEAEEKLLEKGQEYLNKFSQPKVSYGLTIDPMFLKKLVGSEAGSNIIWVGDYIPVLDNDLDVDKSIRVKSFSRDLLNEYSYQLTIADIPVSVSTISRIISELNGLDKIVKINDLADPAKARRAYLNAQEVLSMVFDSEGNYYTDKIAPLSVDTSMLSVGAKSTQFGMVGTVFQTNYGGAKNRIVYAGGTLTHYAILEGSNPRSWTITDGDVTLASDAAFYIYAKCAKTGSGGSILFSTSQIIVDSDGSFYHFLIGVINSVGTNNERAIALMYGFTTINGRFIKTGRLTSATGSTYFDLDSGTIQGDIRFTSGQSIQGAVDAATGTANGALSTAASAQTAASSAQTTASAAQTAATNAQTSASSALSQITDIVSDNVLSAAEKPSQRLAWNTIAAEKSGIDTQADSFSVARTTYDNAFQALATYLNARTTWTSGIPTWLSDANLATNTTIVGSTYRTNWQAYYDSRTALLNAIAAKAKALADAAQTAADSKPQHFRSQPAPPYRAGDLWTDTNVLLRCKTTRLTGSYTAADWESAVAYDNTSTVISGGLVTTGTLQVVQGGTLAAGITGNDSGDNAVRMWAGETYANRNDAPFRVTQAGEVTMTNANVTGTINSDSGLIGGFTIDNNRLVASNTTDEMILSAALIRFHSVEDSSYVYIGGDVMPSSMGGAIACSVRIEVARTVSPDFGINGNVGIYFNVTGVNQNDNVDYVYTGNHALYIESGDILGFRIKTRRVSSSQTLSHLDSVILAIPTADITLYLPAAPQPGQLYFIRRCTTPLITLNASGNNITWTDTGSMSEEKSIGGWHEAILHWDNVNNIWWGAQTRNM